MLLLHNLAADIKMDVRERERERGLKKGENDQECLSNPHINDSPQSGYELWGNKITQKMGTRRQSDHVSEVDA